MHLEYPVAYDQTAAWMKNDIVHLLKDPNYAGDKRELVRRFFMSGWNSGQMARNYENYLRDLRVSLGYHNRQLHFQFSSENIEASIKKIDGILASRGIQIIYARNRVIWGTLISHDGTPLAVVSVAAEGDNTISIFVEGDELMAKDIIATCSVDSEFNGVCVRELISLKGEDRPSYIFPNNTTLIGKDHYYPWLKKHDCTLREFIDEFLSAKASGILFYGDPGTGKSTLIRTIYLQAKRKNNYLVADEQLMRWESFGTWLRGLQHGSIVAVEDADNILRRRDMENMAMSSLLNLMDGVIPNDSKYVISTNLPSLEKVDFALDRKGRMHACVHFELLTAQQANEIREIDGLPRLDFCDNSKYSLADVLNSTEESFSHIRRIGQKGFGFNG